MVVGVIAGGYGALVKTAEGAEDDVNAGAAAMDHCGGDTARHCRRHRREWHDALRGRALARAQTLGAKTVFVTCSTLPSSSPKLATS